MARSGRGKGLICRRSCIDGLLLVECRQGGSLQSGWSGWRSCLALPPVVKGFFCFGLASLLFPPALLMGLSIGDVYIPRLALLTEVFVGYALGGHAKASAMLPNEAAITLDGESVVIADAANAADHARIIVCIERGLLFGWDVGWILL